MNPFHDTSRQPGFPEPDEHASELGEDYLIRAKQSVDAQEHSLSSKDMIILIVCLVVLGWCFGSWLLDIFKELK